MKLVAGTILLLVTSLLSFGQRVVVPVENNLDQANQYTRTSGMRIAAAGDTLTLPFFEDFTQTNISPNLQRWLPGGGVYINNQYGYLPPNYNVATFDGVKDDGTQYNANPLSSGAVDKLTSKPIDLSAFQNGDSLYFRFYWQAGIIGDSPEAADSLRLQFRVKTGPNPATDFAWRTVWKKTGQSSPFNHVLLRIGDNNKYYYNGFQFRFESFGRQSGAYDIWNIDYIHLDTGRLAKENWTPDVGFGENPTSFLKNYSAMPIHQYLIDKKGETADSIIVRVTNLRNYPRNITFNSTKSMLKDIQNNVAIESTSDTAVYFDEKLINTGVSQYYRGDSLIRYIPNLSLFPGGNTPRILKYTFAINDTLDPKVNRNYLFTTGADSVPSRIDFTQNDSISGYTYLTDYYSYDDGSAEYGYGVNQNLGKVAVKYHLNEQDTITHVDIYFPPIDQDQTNEALLLSVWSSVSVGSSSENLVYYQSVSLQHSNALNKFQRYQLSKPVILPAGDFYVGYQQKTNELIYTGFDRNINHRSSIFYTVNGVWKQESVESGSLMIRPVLQNAIITSIHPPSSPSKEELRCEVYPNPTTGELFIAGKISSIYLYDLSGKLLMNKEYNAQVEEIHKEDIGNLPNGFYLLHLENEGVKTVKKIVLSR